MILLSKSIVYNDKKYPKHNLKKKKIEFINYVPNYIILYIIDYLIDLDIQLCIILFFYIYIL